MKSLYISQERIKEVLSYDTDYGIFTWLDHVTHKKTKHPGNKGKKSRYGQIKIDNVSHYSHRLAWVFVFGDIPDNMLVDHKDGDTGNNKISNLRLSTKVQNGCNSKIRTHNKLKLKGVEQHRDTKRFAARITVNGERINLGTYDTAEEAHKVYCDAAVKYHKEFARTN